MSTPLGGIRPTERPISTDQITSPAPASSAGIGETPSSLCCLGGDANDSIFSRIWTTVTSFISSVWAWLTGLCSGGETATPPTELGQADPAVAVLRTRPLRIEARFRESFQRNIQTSLGELFAEAHAVNVNLQDLKALLVFKLNNEIILVTPRPVDSVDAFQVLRAQGENEIVNALHHHPQTEDSELNITLMLLEGGSGNQVRQRRFSRIVTERSIQPNSHIPYLWGSKLDARVGLEPFFGEWEGSTDMGDVRQWAQNLGTGRSRPGPGNRYNVLIGNQVGILMNWIEQ